MIQNKSNLCINRLLGRSISKYLLSVGVICTGINPVIANDFNNVL